MKTRKTWHEKANKLECTTHEDPNEPGKPPSLVFAGVFAVGMEAAKILSYFLHSEDSDQTGQLPKLILLFPGRTSYFVGYVVLPLKCLSMS